MGDGDAGVDRQASASSSGTGERIRTIEWRDGAVVMIDQRRLPLEEVYISCRTWQELGESICNMTVRGAPALGVAAAMGMALAGRTALAEAGSDPVRFRSLLQDATKGLFATRPTAYNLPWALREMEGVWRRQDLAPEGIAAQMERLALQIYEDDLASCHAIGEYGADLVEAENPVILTH